MSTFGIEEEFLLIDRGNNFPARPTPEQSAHLVSLTAGGGEATPEWLSCQVEETSPVFLDAATAMTSLVEFRTGLREAANALGMDVVGVGAAPDMGSEPALVTPGERYERLAGHTPAIAADQYVCGTHVHLGFPDLEVAVRALNGLRGWLPVLVAIGANSPVWRGEESGFESWRSIHYRRWIANGVPPHFLDLHDYDSRVAVLAAFDAVEGPVSLSWLARLSHRHGTLEVRACDAQLEAQDSVAIAVFTRALANYALEVPPAVTFTQEYLDIALWQSARWGLSGRLLDPLSATLVPAERLVGTLLERLRGYYTTDEERRFAEGGVRRILQDGNGASRQRRAYARAGVPGIMTLATRAMTAAPPGSV